KGRRTPRQSRSVVHRAACASLDPRDTSPPAGGLFRSRVYRYRRTDELRGKPCGAISPGRHLCRSHPQGRKTIRSACDPADQVRVRDQPADGTNARTYRAGDAARARRRGDRIKMPFAAAPGRCRSPWLRTNGFEFVGMGHFWLVDFVDCIERCYIQTFPFLFPSFMPLAPFALLPSVTAIACIVRHFAHDLVSKCFHDADN